MAAIIGIDETERGPLADPVTAGVIRAPEGYDLLETFPGLNDSKKLSEKKRETIYLKLQEEVKAGNIEAIVCFSSERIIDRKGIAFAVRSALTRGLEKLLPDPTEGSVFLDGSLKAPSYYKQETIIGGDAIVPAIMLASIAAKVTRDHLLKKLALEYPLYGFEVHKGYGTKKHLEAIKEHGLCAIHRATFIHLDRLTEQS